MSRFFKLTFVYLVTISITTSTLVNAAQNSKFAEYSKKQKQKYSQFKTDYLDRYEKYRTEIKAKWGVAELSSKTEYVCYSEEYDTKVITDFENDTIEVSILAADKLTDVEIDNKIRAAIIDSLDKEPEQIANTQVEFDTAKAKDQNNTIPPISTSEKTDKKEVTPTILAHLGINSEEMLTSVINSVKAVSAKQQEQAIVKRTQARIDKQIASLENFTTNDEVKPEQVQETKALIVSMKKEKQAVANDVNELTKKNIKTYKISLKRDRFKRAEQYLTLVETNAQKWQLSEQFILAIMETESHFNPLAKSYVPAYGLMQIVPSTAGADVNTKVLGLKDRPTPELLFIGSDNIKYGSAYLNLLMTRYLKEIKDPTSRLYCAIAAYNTGIGNVARAFNQGKKGRLKAMKVINTLTPDEVYNIIKKRTHTETQRYLDKVLESRQYFTKHKA